MFLVEGPEAHKIETDENGIFETEGTQSLPIEAIAKRVHRPTQGLMFLRPEPAKTYRFSRHALASFLRPLFGRAS